MKQLSLAVKQLGLTSILLALGFATGCRTTHDTVFSKEESHIARPRTFTSFDTSSGTNAPIPAHGMKFLEADARTVLNLYEVLSGRTLILSPQVPMTMKFTFENGTPLTIVEALQLLDDVLAGYQIVMVYEGSQYVKVLPISMATKEPGPLVERPWKQLPDSSTYITYVVKLKKLKAEDAVPILQPFARLPNSIVAMKGANTIVLRDFSNNIRRMMEVLERVEAGSNPTK